MNESVENKGLISYRTETGSTYEINYDEKKMRRLTGAHAPTNHQGPDGEWKNFLIIDDSNDCLVIIWRFDETDEGTIARRTITSKIVEKKNVDSDSSQRA